MRPTQGPDDLTSRFIPDDPIPGNLVRAIVQFTDGAGVLRQIVSAPTAAVENVNDVPTGPVLIPDVVAIGTVLTATAFADNDGIESIVEDQTVEYVWYSAPAGTPAPATGAAMADWPAWTAAASTGTDPFFEVTDDLGGRQILVAVSYTDDHGTEETAISAPTTPVLGAPPANTPPTGQLVLLPATPQVGETVAVDTSAIADADGPADIGFGFRWYREVEGGWELIEGAENAFFEPDLGLLGTRLKVVAWYVDDGAATEAVELVTEPVAAAVNPAPGVPGSFAAVGGDDRISLSWSTSSDNDLAGYRLYRRNTAAVGLVPANLIAELPAGATSYDDVLPAGTTRYYVLVAVDGAGSSSSPTSVVSARVKTPLADFEAVTPGRLFDTRAGSAEGLVAVPKQRLAADQVLEVKVTDLPGRVPATDVGAVSLNVTVVGPSGGGWLAVVPCGSSNTTSSVNFLAGGATANAVLSAVSASGKVCFKSSVDTDLVVDLTGWFPTSGDFQAVTTKRVFDTRSGGSGLRTVPTAMVTPAAELAVKLTDLPGVVPAGGVGAVSLNVTVADPVAGGWLAVVPCGSSNTTSSLNFGAGGATANAVITAVPASGKVCFRTSVATNVIVDINGWFPTTSDFHAIAPDRVFDTRPGAPATLRTVPKTLVQPGQPLAVKMTDLAGLVPASGVRAVSLNVTVTGASEGGWVGVVPCGSTDVTSSVNFDAGATVANAVLVAVPTNGEVCFISSVPTHLIADINGWFAD